MNTKKENRNSYKQMKFRIGIFQIRNLKNNKLFLETSTDLDRAYNSDLFQLKAGMHNNRQLQIDWNNDGVENFEFSILDELKLDETATELEIKRNLKEFLELCRIDLLENGNILY